MAGLRVVHAPAVVAAIAVGVVTTLCCAWRWRRVAARLGVRLPLSEAVTAYYRSQFLNATLPTGVVGDVHRALRHGRALGDVGLGARAVVLERTGSLVTQVTIAGVLLLLLPSPFSVPSLVLPGVALVTAAVCVFAARPGPIDRTLLLVVLVSSGLALAGHLAVFLIAARAAGSTAPLGALVTPMLLALLAMAVPISLAGWGPREGVAAWAFGAAGLGEARGVTTAVAYGVLSLVACLPGAAVLVADWVRSMAARAPEPVAVSQGGRHE
jgi:uncharacterized membrane protein YbhN (UPF0104 family)